MVKKFRGMFLNYMPFCCYVYILAGDTPIFVTNIFTAARYRLKVSMFTLNFSNLPDKSISSLFFSSKGRAIE
jgi:hypothetical protein